jgi:uncharacterized protein (DUF849 family)
VIQGALNGSKSAGDHPAVPVSIAGLVDDARACLDVGAGAFHVHPRDEWGRESLAPMVIDSTVAEIRSAVGVPVGVSTGAWIEPDLDRRLALIAGWTAPDYASVNLSEDGAEAVMALLLERGIGIEAGICSMADVAALAATGLADRVMRILIEVGEEQVGDDVDEALAGVDAIHRALDRIGRVTPRLQHGDGPVAWVVLDDAIRRGIDTRIGFEDTLWLPDGTPASSNMALVEAAIHQDVTHEQTNRTDKTN